ncbi:glycosyltransferase [Pseudoxanthomonas sp. X-1]|uniref:glycosyltransferase n=1 Tax=Pseudoxanthomonas sp. X-1 TaxID=2571115 RepID=UPI0019822F9E|nr:glycosyltransferase [Pseudoxanthomonas sp. X-1]
MTPHDHGAQARSGGRPLLTVLQQFNAPTPRTNPYLVQLLAALAPLVRVRFWSLRTALLSRYDVVHLHWPEYTMRHPTVLGRLLRQCAVALLLLRWTVLRTPIVRTLHNLTPHEQGGAVERWLLRRMDRMTSRWIRINQTTEPRAPGTDTALHGHYVDWFAPHPQAAQVTGRLLHFGLIRPYKGVEGLLASMADLAEPDCSLRVVGNPASPQMRALVEAACTRDPRVSALLQYVDDPTLAMEVSASELVVLPYRDMHNSGTLLLALSLARPVLVPRTPNNAAVADEVGPGWVFMYEGELDAQVIRSGLAQARATRRAPMPDLSRRAWSQAGRLHYRSYLAAIRQRRGLPAAGVTPSAPERRSIDSRSR